MLLQTCSLIANNPQLQRYNPLAFAINMVFQYKKIGKWKEYVFGEKMYILLSLLAKSALAWQVFAGTLRPVYIVFKAILWFISIRHPAH
jgi:hypothetical protein